MAPAADLNLFPRRMGHGAFPHPSEICVAAMSIGSAPAGIAQHSNRSRSSMISGRARGQVLQLFVIFAPITLAFMGLGLDEARLFLERRDAQGAADLAALGAARELTITSDPDDLAAEQGLATTKAIDIAAAN
jgi:hypothetical protein